MYTHIADFIRNCDSQLYVIAKYSYILYTVYEIGKGI